MTAHEAAECCYAMAYYVLPQHAVEASEQLIDRLSEGRIGAMFFFLVACHLKGIETGEQDAGTVAAFAAHQGSLDERHEYWIIQYPLPTKVDLSKEMNSQDPDKMLEAMQKVVLAPYFSALIRDKVSQKVAYFVLGQSVDGFTTLRTVNKEMNANLGRGCKPDLSAFLGLLRDRMANPTEAVAAVIYDRQPRKRWWEFWK